MSSAAVSKKQVSSSAAAKAGKRGSKKKTGSKSISLSQRTGQHRYDLLKYHVKSCTK